MSIADRPGPLLMGGGDADALFDLGQTSLDLSPVTERVWQSWAIRRDLQRVAQSTQDPASPAKEDQTR